MHKIKLKFLLLVLNKTYQVLYQNFQLKSKKNQKKPAHNNPNNNNKQVMVFNNLKVL